LDNLSIRIVDEQGEDLPSGEVGEVWVKGPSISCGYFNDPKESERVFRDGWLATRDLARLDSDGYLWVQGRLGGFLKMRGIRVSFTEVEARVGSVPGVLDCAAASVPHPEAGEALVLFLVTKPGAAMDLNGLRHQLPAHWVFDSIQFIDEVPKTANGKISRQGLASRLSLTHAGA
jgi:acyl-coenzyme A synthetase/AMP-(fatty) acid ligase